jgi:hypothetical protein
LQTFTLISAPPGYGKTTLLAQWRQAEEASVLFAWVSLDEQNHDLVRIWGHLVEALRQRRTTSKYPPGETRRWVKSDHPAASYAHKCTKEHEWSTMENGGK